LHAYKWTLFDVLRWKTEVAWKVTNAEEANKRAAGRRRYNLARQLEARTRRKRLSEVCKGGRLPHGAQARLAREFGVSEATISRDLAHLRRLY